MYERTKTLTYIYHTGTAPFEHPSFRHVCQAEFMQPLQTTLI